MNLLVVTFAPSLFKNGRIYSYAPYVKEMDIWFQCFDSIHICSPTAYSYGDLLLAPFQRNDINVIGLPEITLKNPLKLFGSTPLILLRLFFAFRKADHIHFRAPGNISLIGLILQTCFPKKQKTAKYAGNWSKYRGEPLSYRIQKKILGSAKWSRNMKVLVYGNWPKQSSNIVPFFTATYSRSEIPALIEKPNFTCIGLVFIGTLAKNKNPKLSILVAEKLAEMGYTLDLHILGDGPERKDLEDLIRRSQIRNRIHLRGNVTSEEVKNVLTRSHFLIFLSDSEGWPKAVAEAMFWGCVPVVTPISCVPWMLGNGVRGILVGKDQIDSALTQMVELIGDPIKYSRASTEAANWSQAYTLEQFEAGIRRLLKSIHG